MRAIVLAAGMGKRLLPFTKTNPKPLFQILGRSLLQRNIEKLRDSGYEEIIINLFYLGEKIIEEIGDGSKYGIKIHYSLEKELLGTGGGISNALSLLGEDPFLVISSDIWTEFNLSNIFLPQNFDAHMILVPNPKHHPDGDVFLNRNIVEEFGRGERLTFSGIALVSPKLFKGKFKKKYDLWDSLLLPASQNGKVSGELYNGFLLNINTMEDTKKLDAYLSQE